MNSLVRICNVLTNAVKNNVLRAGARSYRSSELVENLGKVTVKYEVTRDPQEWKYVERALPPEIVPEPKPKSSYTSGWKPQQSHSVNLPYFVERTKNHMVPVYLLIDHRGHRRRTMVKKVKGDIFLLEKELRVFLQQDTIVPLRTRVNECAGTILISGDYVNATKYWLTEKGL